MQFSTLGFDWVVCCKLNIAMHKGVGLPFIAWDDSFEVQKGVEVCFTGAWVCGLDVELPVLIGIQDAIIILEYHQAAEGHQGHVEAVSGQCSLGTFSGQLGWWVETAGEPVGWVLQPDHQVKLGWAWVMTSRRSNVGCCRSHNNVNFV